MIPVAILAGGLATRLRPITEKIPKILVPVAGRPFLTHQIELLKKEGINKIVLCVGHLGEQVEEAYGDGSQFEISIEYSFDAPSAPGSPAKLLGTGGALKRALPLLGPEFFVLYGDSYLPTPFAPILSTFQASQLPALMTVFHNEGRYDTSNVWFENKVIKLYDKQNRPPEMHHIDYGLSLFKTEVFDSWPSDQPFDLAEVMKALVDLKQMAGHEVPDRFYEIGSPDGLDELNQLLTSR